MSGRSLSKLSLPDRVLQSYATPVPLSGKGAIVRHPNRSTYARMKHYHYHYLSLNELNNELFERSAGISYRIVGFSHDSRACCSNDQRFCGKQCNKYVSFIYFIWRWGARSCRHARIYEFKFYCYYYYY